MESFQHTAARRRLGLAWQGVALKGIVSTHSRPKAAGCTNWRSWATISCFNTQPPEGGWACPLLTIFRSGMVSTHSRPKAAGFCRFLFGGCTTAVSTHSRPKAAGCTNWRSWATISCFNTQPPEGGWDVLQHCVGGCVSFNTQPPEGGWFDDVAVAAGEIWFQHTAARRRLANVMTLSTKLTKFQHTAARRRLARSIG